MKKVCIPTEEEFYQINDMVGNDLTYKYLLIKAIESLIVRGVNYPAMGILKNAYKYVIEFEDIIKSICYLYPEEIKYSEIAQIDNSLCLKLIAREDNNKCQLDNLAYFSNMVNYNKDIIYVTIDRLLNKLNNNQRYRFEYQSSLLLNSIFSGKLDDVYYLESLKKLICIEPIYAIRTPRVYEMVSEDSKCELLRDGINNMVIRYGLDKVNHTNSGNNIFDSKDEDTKKLIKIINRNKDRY